MPDLLTLAFFAFWVGVVGFGLYRGLKPLDRLRRRRTTGIQLTGPEQPVRRGEEVEAQVTISRLEGLDAADVGVVCTEYYDEEDTDSEGRTTTTTSEAIAHERRVAVEPVLGAQDVRVPIPKDAPFSYEGEVLSFRWELVARGRRKHHLDEQAAQKLVVLP